MTEYNFLIEREMENKRIDKCICVLADAAALSRSYLQKLVKEKAVLVNKAPVKTNYRVKAGDEITLLLPEAVKPDILPEDIPLSILYEDDDLLIIDKPKGMVVHPAAGHYSGTLVNAVMYHCKDSLSGINGVMRPGIVHRIDRDTTGALVICKNDAAHTFVAEQLQEHSLTRKYRAIVHGVIKEEEGCINAPIGRHKTDRKKMDVHTANSKPAITHYKVLQRFRQYTCIECMLKTGRTHQIRVHMTSIGHPLLGDEVYGKRKTQFTLQGQTLHAMVIGLKHPATGEYMEFSAPLPDYFVHLLEVLRNE